MKTNNPIEEFYKYVDKRIVDIVQFVRTKTNKVVVINNWHKGGTYSFRGWRPKNCKIGAKLSTHKTGKAVDFDIVGMTDKEVKDFVIKHQKELYDLGTIKEGEKIKHNIIYTNTGKYPLIIFSAIGSCGCTVPEYKKEPLAPGMSDTLSFTFNSEGKHGNHTKTISVLANTNPSSNQVKFSVKVK